MKKLFSLIVGILLLLSLSSCSSQLEDRPDPTSFRPKPPRVNTSINVKYRLYSQYGLQSHMNTKEHATEETLQDPNETTQATQPATTDSFVNRTLLVDEAGIKITALGVSSERFGPVLKLYVENNTDKNLTIQNRKTSANGYMVDATMSVDVEPGKTAYGGITFYSSQLETCSIDGIAEMEFSFHIFTSEERIPYLDTDLIQVKTSISDLRSDSCEVSGIVAYDNNGIKIIVKEDLAEGSFAIGHNLDPSLTVYIENNSDKDIIVQERDVYVNGTIVDTLFSSEVLSGKRAVESIVFPSSGLEANGISEFEIIEFYFHVFDSNTWFTIANTDMFILTFNQPATVE